MYINENNRHRFVVISSLQHLSKISKEVFLKGRKWYRFMEKLNSFQIRKIEIKYYCRELCLSVREKRVLEILDLYMCKF